ncbi:MAG: hypothetical protein K8F60_05475 [Melioribacteraceae bacterium]|jgi:hypothetical protein|nr:hypothetical protein [Melioribacteraceae bacterium]
MRSSYAAEGINGKKSKAKELINKFAWQPLKSGLIGFIAFFVVLVVTKLLSFLIGTRDIFHIEVEDLTVSFIGFILLYLFTFVEQFKDSRENKS